MDIGSSSTRSAIFDERCRLVPASLASRKYAVTYGADGAAELDPQSLLRAVRLCVRETQSHASGAPISAISASAFWHGLLGLSRQRQPVTPVYMWADNRAADDARELREDFDERAVHARTGCMLRASFWPAKLAWLRRTNASRFRSVAHWVAPAEWIFEQLFQTAGCSLSMASATGLWDQRRRAWDEELCDAVRVDPRRLSSITESTDGDDGAVVFAAIGDGAAGNLGSGADDEHTIAINVGTSAAVRRLAAARDAAAPFGLFRYALDETRSVIGGATSNAGNLRRWCLRELRAAPDDNTLRRADRVAAAGSALDVLPFWVGERAPTWPENIAGVIAGLRQTTTAAEIERAAVCASFYRLAQILDLLERGAPRQIVVSGGILRSPALLTLLADSLGRDIHAATEMEASLRGAAIYALQKLGFKTPRLRIGKTVKCDSRLAQKHRARRARQEELESVFTRLP